MATTPYGSLRYPTSTDVPNVPQFIQNLATDLDQKVTVQVATPAARTALTSGQKYDGMRVYEQSTRRFYRWDGSVWQYDGGAPPPILAVTINAGGWTAVSNFEPGCYKDASGLVTVVGGFVNSSSSYNPGGQLPLTLPVGYWPGRDTAVQISAPVGSGMILGGVYTADGTIRVNYNNGVLVPLNTMHTVNFSFHPGFDGGALA